MASPIEQYIHTLERALEFDLALAQRVCAEVEDHLHERAASYITINRYDAETSAIDRFGTTQQLAAQFALASIRKNVERLCISMLGLVFIVFAIMRWRVAAIAEIGPVPQVPPFRCVCRGDSPMRFLAGVAYRSARLCSMSFPNLRFF